jgi:hypothetical protein
MRRLKNTTVVSSGVARAQAFRIFWQSKDLNQFPLEYASSLASRINIPFATSTPPAPGAGPGTGIPPPTSSPTPELSTAAKTGIGVGAALGCAFAIGTIFITLLWRRQRHRISSTEEEKIDLAAKPELPGDDAVKEADSSAGTHPELPTNTTSVNEADADAGVIPEIDSRSVNIVPGSSAELP